MRSLGGGLCMRISSEKSAKRKRGMHVGGDFCGAEAWLLSGPGAKRGLCGSEVYPVLCEVLEVTGTEPRGWEE